MYRQLYKPDHHRADITGMVPVHIIVAEKELGRPLKKGEIVHHKNFNKLISDPDNLLFPITRPEHQKLPEYQARFILSKDLYEEFLAWWVVAKQVDEDNNELETKERELVKLQNEQERLKGRADRGRG